MHLAYAVDVCKAEQLGKKALQTPRGYLLDQVVPAGGGKYSLFPAAAGQLGEGVHGVGHHRAGVHPGIVVRHKVLCQHGVGMPGKVKPGKAVVVLNGEAEQLPVLGQIIPLRVAVAFQHPVQAPVGKIHIVH